MESPRGLTETLDAIRTLRELGATRVQIGDVDVTFAPGLAALTGFAADVAPKLTPEEQAEAKRREYEATLFHSAE